MADFDLGEELYERCNKAAVSSVEGIKKQFSQADLLELCGTKPLDHITNGGLLIPIITQLQDNALFIIFKKGTGHFWSLRPRDAAKHFLGLGREERMIYQTIEDAHAEGVWVRTIKNKTGMNKDSTGFERLLAKLQRLNLIKNIKNVKNANQRTYMLAHLVPSDEVTGGSFYDAGELDESLVEELSNLIVFHVRQMSWVDERKKRIKREHSPILIRDEEDHTIAGVESRGRKKRKRDTTSTIIVDDIEDAAPSRKHRSHKYTDDAETDVGPAQLAFPAGHVYPNATSIHTYITSSGVFRAVKAKSLTVEEVQNVLNVLVWDEKLEQVNGGYRTIRGVKYKQLGVDDDEDEEERTRRGNGLTEVPCGRCPVIDLCGTGGPVNVASCVYFERWLRQGAGG